MADTALLIIDVINHFEFTGGSALAQQTLSLAPRLKILRDRFGTAGCPVIYCNDNWMDWQGDFNDLVASCRQRGGASASLAGILTPRDEHHYILKPKQSAFMSTALPVFLEQLGITRLVLTGIAADSCILATAMDAHMHDYALWVPRDCTASRTPALKKAALHLLRHTCEAETRPSHGFDGIFPGASS